MAMIQFAYKQSNADHTLFVKWKDGHLLIRILYVNDMLITGDNIKEILLLDYPLAREESLR